MASTTSDASASTFSMKLLVDTKGGRVLYAEAGKDVVDFLFSLLALPVGTVVKILSQDAMVGSIGNLYRSVETPDETYVRSGDARAALLAPAGGYDGGKLLQGVRAGRGDVHGDGRPEGGAHVHHLRHHPAQHLRHHRHRHAPGEDRAAGLQRGNVVANSTFFFERGVYTNFTTQIMSFFFPSRACFCFVRASTISYFFGIGFGDPARGAAVQDRAHRRLPWEETQGLMRQSSAAR